MRFGVGLALGLLFSVVVCCFQGSAEVVATAPCCNGDVNGDGVIDQKDVVYLAQYLHKADTPAPVPIVCPPCPPERLPATGQAVCYDDTWPDANPVDCDSAEYPGQDPFYSAGCPLIERFVENLNGTVTDTCTGLMWQKDPADVNGDGQPEIVNWRQALLYCEALTLSTHTDWRLPNIRELETLVNYGQWSPALPLVFSDLAPHQYWSSTSSAEIPRQAWFVDCEYGYTQYKSKTWNSYVRACREVQPGG